MKRTFIAIEVRPEAALLQALGRLTETLGHETLRWARPSDFHVTLHFIGQTDEAAEAQILRILAAFSACRASFQFRLNGLSCFVRRGEPQVLFVGVSDDEALQRLVAGLLKVLSEGGFPVDQKPFRPHLTLARMKRVADKELFAQTLTEHAGNFRQTVNAGQIVFYESRTQPGGSEYIPISRFKLYG